MVQQEAAGNNRSCSMSAKGDLEMGGVLGSVSVRVARELLQSGHQYLDVSTRYLLGNGRLLSAVSSNMDGPFKVQEVETVDVPPPPTEKLLVLGGNGFVGSHVCKEALDKGLSVFSMRRRGTTMQSPEPGNFILVDGGREL